MDNFDDFQSSDDSFVEDDVGRNESPPRARSGTSPQRQEPAACMNCRYKNKYKNSKIHDIAFTLACILVGAVCIVGICAGVIITHNALKPGDTTIQTQHNNNGTDDVKIAYDENGKMYITVNVPSQKTSDTKIDVTINDVPYDPSDDITPASTDTEPTTEITSEPTVDPDVEPTDEPDQSDVKPTEDETKPDPTGNDDTQESDQPTVEPTVDPDDTNVEKPTDESSIDDDKKPATQAEYEQMILSEMHQRIAKGGDGYSADDQFYTVVKGDCLWKISQSTGFSVDFLAEYNHIPNKDLIYVNQVIRYPASH